LTYQGHSDAGVLCERQVLIRKELALCAAREGFASSTSNALANCESARLPPEATRQRQEFRYQH
jgi:hypothetical protein